MKSHETFETECDSFFENSSTEMPFKIFQIDQDRISPEKSAELITTASATAAIFV